jgi:ABC-type lipoprotein export system ATPase subunit
MSSVGATEEPVLEIEGLQHRLYDPQRRQEFIVHVGDCLRFWPGQFITLLGPNACGKTTLLSVLGLLRKPSALATLRRFTMRLPGVGGLDTVNLVDAWQKPRVIEALRRRHLGFALQSGELIPELTARENIALPLQLNGARGGEVQARVEALLAGFGLLKGDAGSRVPRSRINKLSGGEYQRVALARAIVHRPALVFVDEPTASLNQLTAREALGQLRQLQKESCDRTVVVMITHDTILAREFSDVIVHMEAVSATAGRVARVETNTPVFSVKAGASERVSERETASDVPASVDGNLEGPAL